MLKSGSAALALLAFNISATVPALAAGCATPVDANALKTAVMQQKLMVAAFQCHEAGAYNRFVTTYRSELQSSDAALKAFFVRRGGEHGYDSFKTKAANLSALEQARNAGAFCADAHALYAAAFAHRGSLMSFVESRSVDIGNICVESRPVLARTNTGVKVAEAHPAQVAVGGVPAHSLPAAPYRRDDAALPSRTQDDNARDRDDAAPSYAYEEEAPPPPRPRYYDNRSRDYADRDYGYYGPPPRWRDAPPPPRYGWYPRGYYGGW